MRKAIVEPLVEFNHSRIGKPETYCPLGHSAFRAGK